MEIKERMFSIISRTFDGKVSIEKIEKEGIAALGINSMKFLLLVTSIENEFDIEFDDEEINYDMFGDFHQICANIEQKINQRNIV